MEGTSRSGCLLAMALCCFFWAGVLIVALWRGWL